METEKSFSGEEAEKDFCGRLFFLAAIFPFSNEKACLGVTAKTDFFYRLKGLPQSGRPFVMHSILLDFHDAVGLDGHLCAGLDVFKKLVAQTVNNGHLCVRPHVTEDGAGGRKRIDGL